MLVIFVEFHLVCFSAVRQVAYVSALLCDQTMEPQEEKVNTVADWLADQATSWLLGNVGGACSFWEGVRGLSILFPCKGPLSM